jgi:arginyl-tRNA synthetase
MNNWVYEGFDKTYERLGVSFDKLYYESNTWELGKSMVTDGLEKGLFYQKEDGSVWVDLEDQGLDHKILLRSDGTSVYITQDLGTAHLRYEDMGVDRMIYVVADEQDYHFQVLFAALKKLGEPYADGLHHLSYGMVDLPSGKMKSREGTVVDADDLMDTVFEEAQKATRDRGEISALTADEQDEIITKISLSALKYYILRVDPKKRMMFDPTESVDLQGQTGPYIQNAFVRINSILNRGGSAAKADGAYALNVEERRLLSELIAFPDVVDEAARQYNPSLVAQYCYSLSKAFHRFYHDHRVLNAESEAAQVFRLRLIPQIAHVLKQGMQLLGIGMPEKM